MTGKAGKSGNRTDRRGSRYIQRPILSWATAQEIKILMLAEGLAYTPETVAAWLAARIHRDYLAYDTEVSQAAEWEGQLL